MSPPKPAAQGGVRCEKLESGALWRIVLDEPKANILDIRKTQAITSIFQEARAHDGLKAIVFEGAGPHFSFGASVQEHLPENVEAMIRTFHELFKVMLDTPVPTLAAVRGQCLGGALELVSFCNRIFAAPDARLGQPEIRLGVFAPVASVVLSERIGRGRAEDLCLTGRSLRAEEALRIGLVDQIDDDPSEAAITYAHEHLMMHSASSLRLAVRAIRAGFTRRFLTDLQVVESLYLKELMATQDAAEGLRAFLEKRPPVWRNA